MIHSVSFTDGLTGRIMWVGVGEGGLTAVFRYLTLDPKVIFFILKTFEGFLLEIIRFQGTFQF